MSWARIDDGLDEHAKVDAMLEADELTALAAVGLWVLTLAGASRRGTDGAVSRRALAKIAPEHGERLAGVLLEAGLFDKAGDGHQIHDFLDWNPSAREARQKRDHISQVRAEAGRRGGLTTATRRQVAERLARIESEGAAPVAEQKPQQRAQQLANPVAEQKASPLPTHPTPSHPSPSRVAAREGRLALAEQIVGVLQRGIDGIPTDEQMKRPKIPVISAALEEHPVPDDVAYAVAVDTRGAVQALGRAPNVAGLFTKKLAAKAAELEAAA